MLLSHAVLAVVYGGLLAAAYPGPGGAGANKAFDEDFEAWDHDRGYTQENAAREDGSWKWIPSAPQMVMGTQVPYGLHPPPHHVPAEPPQAPPYPPVPEPPETGPVPPPPHTHPGHPPDASTLTIYQYLESNPSFSRLFKLVNYTEEITSLLNDTSAKLTFFALPDWSFPHRPRPHHPHKDSHTCTDSDDEILDILSAAEGIVDLRSDKTDKDKKEIIKAILKAVFKYETLPAAYIASELASNVTYATSLTLPDGSLDGEPLRVRIGTHPSLFPFPTGVNVNVISHIVHPDIKTANGIVHVVNKAIIPPPSIFQLAFLLPDSISTLTSALQRVGLTDAVEWHEVPSSEGKHTVEGSPAVTVFAPTNKAFSRLPTRLQHFLFSPFGEKVLKKLLQFHIVPELVLHADYIHNASDSDVHRRGWEDEDAFDVYANIDQSNDAGFMSECQGQRERFHGLEGPRGQSPGYEAWGSSAPPYGPQSCEFERPHPIPPQSPHHGPWHMPPPPPAGGQYWGSAYYGHGYAEHPPHFSSPPFRPSFEHGPQVPPHFPLPPPHHGAHHEEPHFPPSPFEHPRGPYYGPHSLLRPPPPFHPPFEHGPLPPPHFPPHRPSFQPQTRCRCSANEGHHGIPRPKVVYTRNTTHPTLLANHAVNVVVVQYEVPFLSPGKHAPTYRTGTFAHGNYVRVSDIPTRNGALHIVDQLLNPRKKSLPPPHEPGQSFGVFEGPEDQWAGWENWLIEWANEE
ncbi:hypothetical protein BN946_scf184593.g9 [Trametes cinnabarina]|uniref:FAS1 domain-containing protein n=1 Tax=Pycnoporus cinnabarinus TaxID=5643 RepID=A0A060SJQ6_PYCCI|nr:hypothetical protein BN946_scf184593.g9 [Trametes cinnabarina]